MKTAQRRRVLLAAILSIATLAQAGGVVPGEPDQILQVFGDGSQLLSETAYRDGRKSGRHVSFWPNGGLRVRAFYEADMIEGEYRAWHANGRIAEVKQYSAGRETGLQQAWTDEGELFLNFEVRNGRHYGLINSKPCLPVQGPRGTM